MSITKLGTEQTGVKHLSTYTAEAGTNRSIILLLAGETSTGGEGNTGVTLGGNAMQGYALADASNRVDAPVNTGDVMYSEVWKLDEADIQAGAQTISITGPQSAKFEGLIFTLSGSLGVPVISDSAVDEKVESLDLSASLNSSTGDYILAIANDKFVGRTYTWTNVTKIADYADTVAGVDFMFSVAEQSVGSDGVVNVIADVSSTSTSAGITLSTVNITDALVASITSSDAQAGFGGTITFDVSNFGSAINSATIGDGTYTLTLTNITNTVGDTYTADVPAVSHGLVSPDLVTGLTLTVGDGTDTATATIELIAPTGFTEGAIGTFTPSTDEEDWSFGLTGLDNTDTGITRDADTFVTHNLSTGASAWTDYGTTQLYTWDSSDGSWTSIQITRSLGGMTSTTIGSTQISSSQITSEGI